MNVQESQTDAIPSSAVERKTVALATYQGTVFLDDVLDLTTPTGRSIRGVRIVRIDEWSKVPFKVQYRVSDGSLRNDAFNLNQCSWCHAGGKPSDSIH